MNNFILLILCFVAGMLLRRFKRMPDDAPVTLNSFIIHISLPALALLYIHELHLSRDIFLVAVMAWLVFGLSVGFFWLMGRWLHLRRGTTGALMLLGGLGNTSFVGVPMVEAFYGHSGIPIAIVIDQLGSFFVLSVLGITVAGIYSSGRPTAAEIFKRIALFPPFIALVIGLLLMPVDYAEWFTVILKRLSDTLAPLALLSVGMQLRLGHIAEYKRNLALGLVFKLMIAPLAIYLLYVQVLGVHGHAIQVTLFEAAMPPMISAAIVANQHDLDPPLVNLMVAVGIILSFLTLGGWWYMLGAV